MNETTDKVQREPGPAETARARAGRIYTPYVDIVERKDEIIIIADMPGVDENSVDITLEKNVLTIYGRASFEFPEDGRPLLHEYGTGDYRRAFTLSDEVDREKIQASVRNGVLKLIMPKAESAKMRKIPVKNGACN